MCRSIAAQSNTSQCSGALLSAGTDLNDAARSVMGPEACLAGARRQSGSGPLELETYYRMQRHYVEGRNGDGKAFVHQTALGSRAIQSKGCDMKDILGARLREVRLTLMLAQDV